MYAIAAYGGIVQFKQLVEQITQKASSPRSLIQREFRSVDV